MKVGFKCHLLNPQQLLLQSSGSHEYIFHSCIDIMNLKTGVEWWLWPNPRRSLPAHRLPGLIFASSWKTRIFRRKIILVAYAVSPNIPKTLLEIPQRICSPFISRGVGGWAFFFHIWHTYYMVFSVRILHRKNPLLFWKIAGNGITRQRHKIEPCGTITWCFNCIS